MVWKISGPEVRAMAIFQSEQREIKDVRKKKRMSKVAEMCGTILNGHYTCNQSPRRRGE